MVFASKASIPGKGNNWYPSSSPLSFLTRAEEIPAAVLTLSCRRCRTSANGTRVSAFWDDGAQSPCCCASICLTLWVFQGVFLQCRSPPSALSRRNQPPVLPRMATANGRSRSLTFQVQIPARAANTPGRGGQLHGSEQPLLTLNLRPGCETS